MSRRFHLRGSHPPRDVMAVLLLLSSQGIVVEPSAIRGLVADCPIFIIFKHSHLGLFHPYAVVNESLRGFQQFTSKGQIFYPSWLTRYISAYQYLVCPTHHVSHLEYHRYYASDPSYRITIYPNHHK